MEFENSLKVVNAPDSDLYVNGSLISSTNKTKQSRDPTKYYGCLYLNPDEVSKLINKKCYEYIVRIQVELEYNNPLWFCDDKTSQSGIALRELESKNFIVGIPNKDIYFVNPYFISKGNPLNIILCLEYHLQNSKKGYCDVSINDIKKFKKAPPEFVSRYFIKRQLHNLSN